MCAATVNRLGKTEEALDGDGSASRGRSSNGGGTSLKKSPGGGRITSRERRTQAFVLRRVNYGEADRILDLITPEGQVSLMARGVRREKSKLAGGIELFCLSEITYHEGKAKAGGAGLGILTSSKMQKFYSFLLSELGKMELAAEVLRRVARVAEPVGGGDDVSAKAGGKSFFTLVYEILEALETSFDLTLIETYFWLNFLVLGGGAINLSFDVSGARLSPDLVYAWDSVEQAFAPHPSGQYNSDDIKYLRLMLSGGLELCARVKYPAEKLAGLLYIAKGVN